MDMKLKKYRGFVLTQSHVFIFNAKNNILISGDSQ
jgi:hypothetical protein